MQQMTLEQVIDAVQMLPKEDRLALAELIQKNERHEAFVTECNDALESMERGEFATNSLEETLRALKQ